MPVLHGRLIYSKNMRTLAAVAVFFALAFTSGAAPARSRGVPAAPIVLDIYSDFECPHCKLLYEKTLVPLTFEYVDKGKVYLVHHEFPLSIHHHALEAACYACAANRVGKYEQACEILFRQQDSWAASGKVDETVCSILTPAEAKRVRALAKDPSVIAEVQQDIEAGRNLKIDGTPTILLTNRKTMKQYRIPSAASYELLRRFIDQLLAN